MLRELLNFTRALTDDFSTVGVKAINDHELKCRIKKSNPIFYTTFKSLQHISGPQRIYLKAHGSIDDRNGLWTRPGNFVCNGPMNLKTWELNKQITVEKNPLYWDADKVQLK
jgi:oligopeptide transport system substrate-binding protein